MSVTIESKTSFFRLNKKCLANLLGWIELVFIIVKVKELIIKD